MDLPDGGGLLQVWKNIDTLNMTHLVVERFRFGVLQQTWGNRKRGTKVNLGRVLFEDIYFPNSYDACAVAMTSQVLGIMKQGSIRSDGFQ